ncbi:adenylate kinase ADK2 [Aspergillus undulatus]|uniref:adenylate kinase ADK2 n=1 Tax=Aspergillus undulatus TaxID=1810928 RepID=UPI003CCCDF6F
MILKLISSEFNTRGWLSQSSKPSISSSASFILDGFPRTASQATSLDSLVPINFVVHLVTPPSIILSRIASRWVHEPSGRVYNTDFNAPKVPGKDDVTGEPLTQREDDSIETWRQRLHKFEETSKALLQHYQRKGCLWRVEGNSSDEITPKLFAEFERKFC